MYVTRPLSMYKQFPSSLSLPPPEGPNSGILVILDEEAEPTCCFGLCKSHELDDLPFPQNKKIELQYTTGTSGENRHVHCNDVFFIPVLGQPLSSNRYYALQPRGSHKGEAFTNSSEEDAVTCCFCRCFPEIEPQSADEHDIYQQFEIRPTNWGGRFVAKSVAQDGVPPGFLGRKGWRAFTSTPRCFTLGEAPGLDTALRARLPHFDFPLSCKNSEPVVVGKWYCPFIFIKDGRPKDQMTRSMYYEMTLEQRWEQLFAYNNDYNEDNVVVVDTTVEKEVVKVNGTMEISVDDQETVDRVMWFRKGGLGLGLSLSIVERMKWEEERFGWSGGKERQERVKRVEKMETNGEWNRFGWYVLVERFALRRMDGSLALTYDFKHTQSVRNKWE
ncbi:uncharacterized protein LOC108463484 [Gossypium arboreum]|uniref:Uncharacterized protein n=1 Tax=Gossypium arboreum TaxID=29729 RepID=A0ABR0MEG4_GOSAR|nr:uncharacterized protein LOC108463484 [Gossypium arboreum]KAK5771613.1 hypothetical protein PVK06_047838 [Gossypium arboreum]